MKDAYSFHADEADTQKTYTQMAIAYANIFKRCGLEFKQVQADSGTIGGNFSHEFAVLANSGEDEIAFCETCGYASNIELAEARLDFEKTAPKGTEELKEIHTPKKQSVAEVSKFLGLASKQIVKTILLENESGLVAGLVRGDHEINTVKMRNLIGCEWLLPATEKMIEEQLGTLCGFIGPVDLNIPIYVDQEVTILENFVTGANKVDTHFMGVQVQRDFKVQKFGDLRRIQSGDPCPRCEDGKYQVKRGIEVGHIFILGTKYSQAMNAIYLDSNGKENPMVMGCYGIGVGRTAAASVEQNHDEKGIVWPLNLAPFKVIIIPVNFKNDDLKKACKSIYTQLSEMKIEVLLDDRQDRLGVKLKDADLIGIPVQIIVGPKNLEEGKIEIKIRKTQDSQLHPYPQCIQDIPSILKNL